jgi:hypothetical protein
MGNPARYKDYIEWTLPSYLVGNINAFALRVFGFRQGDASNCFLAAIGFRAKDSREFDSIIVCANEEEYEIRWELDPILQIKIASGYIE